MELNGIAAVFVLAAAVGTACQPTKEKTSESHPIKVTEPIADPISAAPWTSYDTVYSHAEDGTTQKLGVKYLADNKIEFRLSDKNGLCDVNYEGIAQNRYPGGDGESDDDEEGEAYFSVEYIFEDAESEIYIRIAEEKDKARIKFVDKTAEETECVPSPDFLLTP